MIARFVARIEYVANNPVDSPLRGKTFINTAG